MFYWKTCLGQFSNFVTNFLTNFVTNNVTNIALTQRHPLVSYNFKNYIREDIETNKAIGANGANEIKSVYPSKKVRILTHCNTGSLATAGYGTALGVIRALFEKKELDHAFCTETRPYNQESLIRFSGWFRS